MVRHGLAFTSGRTAFTYQPRNAILRKRRELCRSYSGPADRLVGSPNAVAIDVEYAHFHVNGEILTAAAEVSVVNEDSEVVYEGFICPDICQLPAVRWIGGVTPQQFRAGRSPDTVKQQLQHNIQGCLLIGYGLAKDLGALQLHHPKAMQRDLMTVRKFQSGRAGQAQKLQQLVLQFLGAVIQSAEHYAREDAQAVMQLYLKHVKNDPSEMTYDQLVQLETSKLMSCIAEAELPPD